MMRVFFEQTGVYGKRLLCCGCMLLMGADVSAQVAPKVELENMGSEDFKIREQGYAGIKKWAYDNIQVSPEILYDTWRSLKDPEVKTRCYSVMKATVIQRKFGRGPGFVGVTMIDTDLPGAGAGGARIRAVRLTLIIPNTPAARAGLSVGDAILKIDHVDFNKAFADDGVNITATEIFIRYIKSKKPGDVITMQVMRAGKKLDFNITLMLRPNAPNVGRPQLWGGRKPLTRKQQGELFFAEWLKKMSR